ncbi:ACP S-malonyltransferase [Chengkuizengella marina]|uniref:[acyl-carrier-protein] S-malonyltransferase n=1 Tax=Chengkuizengella marina TaxID=2507566 RepID=A0A6N9Q7X1_9BACL|nr:ACP S-malonyltransferase [Chengkuizengella marina]NBI31015.1 [acyl-carrier-protein] S-malonyltransferase [Chengkuizengella marina]
MERVAFLFPGQGSQYVGMSKDIVNHYSIAKEVFEEANEVLGMDLQSLCYEGPSEELTKTKNAQLALLTTSIAYFRVIENELGLTPYMLAGHSLGEFSALTCSGVLTFSDALKLVSTRGKLMQQETEQSIGAMTAVSKLSAQTVEQCIEQMTDENGTVAIACYNAEKELVITGHSYEVKRVAEKCAQEGGNVTPLKVSGPFHHQLMTKASEQFHDHLKSYSFQKYKIPVVSNVTGLPHVEDIDELKLNLVSQMIKPVRWVESMKYIFNKGVTTTIELGPRTVLKNLIKRIEPTINSFSFDKGNDRDELKMRFSSTNKQHSSAIHFITQCMTAAITTPNYNWDSNEYEKGVIQPYRKLQQLQKQWTQQEEVLDEDQLKKAFILLQQILKTKKVSSEEQLNILNHLDREVVN